MASRLAQFATRNQKQGIEPKSGKDTRSRKVDTFRRSRHEPTLLDTDVESIGNATTLSFADFEEDADRDDTEPEVKDVDLVASGSVSKPRGRQTHDSTPATPRRRWPHEVSGVRASLNYPDEPLHYNASSNPLYGRDSEGAARLDDVSSLPDSSRGVYSPRDSSPTPQPRDSDETPRRKPTREIDSSSPLGEFKQHIHRTRSPPPPPPQSTRIETTARPAGMLPNSDSPPDATTLLDYSPTTLGKMPYAQLAEEPFETDPAQEDAEAVDSTTVLERIRAIMDDEEDDAAKHARLTVLFAQLPLEQYEAAGDSILEQFGAVFRRFQDIRRRKRAVTTDFERRVAEREKAVRERQDALDRSASWLKRQGEDVMRGGPMER